MITIQFTSAQKANGRVYLKTMVPKARQLILDLVNAKSKAVSPIAQSTVQHLTEDKLDAFIIYQNPMGWHADVLLRKMPPGIPLILGSLANSPSRTKAEAEENGLMVLASVLMFCDENKTKKDGNLKPPVFMLYDHAVRLHAKFFTDVQSILPEGAPLEMMGFPSHARAIQGIEEMLDTYLPRLRETDGKKLNIRMKRLAQDEQAMVMSVLHRAAITRILEYPERTETTATHHGEHSAKQ